MRICFEHHFGKGCGAANPDDAAMCRACGSSLEHALVLLNPGQKILRYTVMNIIGYGRFGAVYEVRARIGNISEHFALKETLRPDRDIGNFQREFRALRYLDHPNLPQYFNSFVMRRRGYLLMELVLGQSLLQRLRQQARLPDGRRQPLDAGQVQTYALQLCEALHYLHNQPQPILHRDIKPDNIRLTPDGTIKLVDFGLLKFAGKDTNPNLVGIGSAPYAPLEQHGNNALSTDERSDIYSMCATLYHLLTGKAPPAALDRLSHQPDPLLPPTCYTPDLPAPVSDAIMMGLSLSSKDRFATVHELSRALQTAESPGLHRILRSHRGKVQSVDHNPTHHTLASGSSAWTVRLWDSTDGRLLHQLNGHSARVNSVVFSPDGNTLASASDGATVRLWDADSGIFLRLFSGSHGSVRCLAWSPDGTILAIAGDDRTVRLLRMTDNRLLHTLRGHAQSVRSVVFSPDGTLLVSAGSDRALIVWDVANGAQRDVFWGHRDSIQSVAWSPDGTLIASASDDTTVRLWQVHDGSTLHQLQGHSAPVNSVVFSPNSLTLASASDDTTVRLWCTRTGNLLNTFTSHASAVNSVRYSPDGELLVTGSDDATVRQWESTAVRELGS